MTEPLTDEQIEDIREYTDSSLTVAQQNVRMLLADRAERIAEIERLRAEVESCRAHPGREFCHYCQAVFDIPSEAADNHWRECEKHPLRAENDELRRLLADAPTHAELGAAVFVVNSLRARQEPYDIARHAAILTKLEAIQALRDLGNHIDDEYIQLIRAIDTEAIARKAVAGEHADLGELRRALLDELRRRGETMIDDLRTQ